jgi:type I restriction enzyme S subunit
MDEWRSCIWGDLATLEYGKALRGYDVAEGPYRVFGTNGPIGWHTKALYNRPSVIVGRKGAYRGINYSSEPFFVIDTAFYLKPKTSLDIRWAYYQLLTQDINGMDSGSAIPSTSRDEFYRLSVALPSFHEQQAIASILGSLDDKIDLNYRMNETLGALAQVIFANEKSLGEWKESTLSELCEIYDGPHATPKLVDNGPIFLGISNLAEGLLDLTDTNHISPADFSQWTRRITPMPGDVVFSYETRLGQVALIPKGLDCCLGRRMGLLRTKPGRVHPLILLHAYMESEFQDIIRQRTIHGSTVDRIPLKDMGGFSIRVPTGTAMASLALRLSPLRERVEHNQQESSTLSETRDLLLPKLISGEIRIKEAEKLMAEVA